jgi:hypothetical protein
MVIRIFSKHLKSQNWFGVFLDFSVVVLGIFIGLQVSDWNQTRIDRQDAAYHLKFLHDELSVAMKSATEEIEQHEATMMNSFGAAMLLSKDDWDPAEEQRFKEQVFSTFEIWGPKHRPVSLRRMIDDGKLDLIESKDLQNAILRFDSAYLEAIEQTKTSYSYSLELTPKITASMKFMGLKIVSTTEELTGNLVLRSAVRDKAIWQRIQLDVLKDLQAARGALREILEANAS